MASAPNFGMDASHTLAPEQDVLKSLLETNQKICSFLETLLQNRASPGQIEPSAHSLGSRQDSLGPLPAVARTLLQNDFDLPEFSYSQFFQSSGKDSLQSKPGYLPAENYTDEDLRNHLNRPYWSPAVKRLLNQVLSHAPFPDTKFMADARFRVPYDHLARLLICVTLESGELFRTRAPLVPPQAYPWSRSMQECWDDLRTTNRSKSGQGPFVGRVVVLREPAPLKLAALHLVMGEHFDMDSIFASLSTQEPTAAYLYPASDEYYGKRQRNFVFTFSYFTIVDGSRCPTAWQTYNTEQSQVEEKIQFSSCSSVVALSLAGQPVSYVERVISGRARKYPVYDPFAPWQVLVLNFFPDLHTGSEVFTTLPRLSNGHEAFLRAVLAQYRDAQKRFAEITTKIIDLTTLGVSFLGFEGLCLLYPFEYP